MVSHLLNAFISKPPKGASEGLGETQLALRATVTWRNYDCFTGL